MEGLIFGILRYCMLGHLSCIIRAWKQGSYKKSQPFLKDFSRTTSDFQGPLTCTRNNYNFTDCTEIHFGNSFKQDFKV